MIRSGIAAFIIAFLFNATAFAASFDCGKAASPVEKMVCSDAQLSELDSLLAKAYKKVLADSPKTVGALKARQRTWLSEKRDKCQDADCLKKVYNDRLAELNSAGSAAAAPGSGSGAGSGSASSSGSASGFPNLVNAQPKPITEEIIENAAYDLSLGDTPEIVTFKNGKFKRGNPGDDNFIDAEITHKAFGDLNGDKIADAAVIIIFNAGGTGTFVSLFAVLAAQGTPSIPNSIALGDRSVIKSLSMSSGKIIVNLITHKASDPACCPTLNRTYTYCLKDGKLVEVKY